MTIPARDTRRAARTDADFRWALRRWVDAAKTTPLDLAGWTLRFVVKSKASDADDLIAIEDGAIVRDDAAGGRFTVLIDKAALAGALPANMDRLSAVYALQAEGPADESEVWAAGPFELMRGL
ncbi:MAG TPA: hypothetical protein PLS69_02290 [Terricaulis sp.]|nr:hypothetical protein [Terricaulis sp.]